MSGCEIKNNDFISELQRDYRKNIHLKLDLCTHF